jgi:hypothetical protein
LEDWPVGQVEDYVTIMNVESQLQDEKNNSRGTHQSPDQTEAAFQAMKQQAMEQQGGGQ